MLARVWGACTQFTSATSVLGARAFGSEAFLPCNTAGSSLARSFTGGAAVSARASPLPTPTGRPRLVILGSGWGGARLVKDIDLNQYDVTIVSTRNHMVFTPLLTSTCVGTLEPRCAAVPIVGLRPELEHPQHKLYIAEATQVDPAARTISCTDTTGLTFEVPYDVLTLSTGSQGSTFGTPGVEEHAHFLRDVANATAIRSTLIKNWMLANIPGRTGPERCRLLHIVVVGGGPTGVEFAGELTDFIQKDLHKIDPARASDIKVTLIEAVELLSAFDGRLREYASQRLTRRGIKIVKGLVKEIRETDLTLDNGDKMEYGLCVWSTGVGPTTFTTALPFAKTARGRIAVDDCQRVLRQIHASGKAAEPSSVDDVERKDRPQEGSADHEDPSNREVVPNIYAVGDCCASATQPLPALAQVAEQQGKYLARVLNAKAKGGQPSAAQLSPFRYRHMGSMATTGGGSAVIDLGKGKSHLTFTGIKSYLAWRSAYLTKLGSWRNRFFTAGNWFMTTLFGRDVSRW
ncbi:hypothetical protein WJX74_005543 [Apatococcus lobatus]|uniref:NADH:ubiquinone reductase (non-electrogenic) n=1 Tax=Apatococcus lobatus TaxID=904363 RepID=A0AAW1SAY7_9CHLO